MQQQFFKVHKNPMKEKWDTDYMYVNISKIITITPIHSKDVSVVRIDNDYVQYFIDNKDVQKLVETESQKFRD